MGRRMLAVSVVCCLILASRDAIAQKVENMTVPSFGTVTIYAPQGAPKAVVLFVSGDGGWSLGVIPMAEQLRAAGALVVGIDIRLFMKSLNTVGTCAYPAGSLEELSRAVQLRMKVPAYQRPILVGYSSGATLVYAAVAAAPPETFAGAVSLGFCPDIEIQKPLCHMRGLVATKRRSLGYDLAPFAGSTVPWMVLQGEVDQVCDASATRTFVAATGAARLFSLPRVGHGFGVSANWAPQFLEAFRAVMTSRLAREAPSPTASAVADLSLVEVPATSRVERGTLAVLMTGDGGWAEVDKSIAAGLAEAGVPVVGWSSLDYYWQARTPAGAAADLARILSHYTTAWRKDRVLVIGYSFGADVLPYLVNRLPDALKSRVEMVVLLDPSETAAFEFHLTNWLGGGADPRYPTVPEIERLGSPVTCVFPSDEPESICRKTKTANFRAVPLGQGHHFGGDYQRVVESILR